MEGGLKVLRKIRSILSPPYVQAEHLFNFYDLPFYTYFYVVLITSIIYMLNIIYLL